MDITKYNTSCRINAEGVNETFDMNNCIDGIINRIEFLNLSRSAVRCFLQNKIKK